MKAADRVARSTGVDEFIVRCRDGRRLRVAVTGDPGGKPVFLLHGTPGSRNGPKPRGIKLDRMGVRLISYDRPGYGDSDRWEGRRVPDAAQDIAAIADHLNLDRFAVAGRSGGGPHALAAAHELGDRVTRVALLVSLAPADADGLDWFDGMNHDNARDYEVVDHEGREFLEGLRRRTETGDSAAEALLARLRPLLTVKDRRVVDDIAMRRLLLATYAEGLKRGHDGWIDDLVAFRKPWDIHFEGIHCPVVLWHGAEDQFSPLNHSVWLTSRIPDARLAVQRGSGHFGAVEILPTLLPWLTEKVSRESLDIPFAVVTHHDQVQDELSRWRVRRDRADRSPDTRELRSVAP